jgi:hypothetical protein
VPARSFVALVNDFATYNRQIDICFMNILDGYVEDVAVYNNEVGKLASLDRTKLFLPAKSEALRSAHREATYGLFQ